jgi:hypothetical protein
MRGLLNSLDVASSGDVVGCPRFSVFRPASSLKAGQRTGRFGGGWGRLAIALLAVLVLALEFGAPAAEVAMPGPYAAWEHGPSRDTAFFPIGVWLQEPQKAQRYREAGINLYVGLWRGPTEAQLADLKKAGLKLICHQNEFALQHLDDPTFIGWMHGDEPDNAQSLGEGKGYGPPIPPAQIVRDYERIRRADPSRPVMLNLGQGVAWDGYRGRGVRTNHPEDYREYLQGCDVASFDIYPAVHTSPEVARKLGFVARGVERLVEWAEGRQVVWNCIECTRISNPKSKATPHQVRAEVWMSLIHGSRGIIYFVHEWQPKFNESALLDDPEMLGAVTQLNRQIQKLAPVLNQPSVAKGLTVASAKPDRPVATLLKAHEGGFFLFTVNMNGEETVADFDLSATMVDAAVTVLDEDRSVPMKEGRFQDRFQPWDVHLYRLERSSSR